MSKDQSDIVKLVYARFIESEEDSWSDIDDNLEMWSWLSDKELITEAKVKIKTHSKGTFRCSQNHKQEHCMAPYILEAVEAIIGLYEKAKQLHEKNKYIILYYLALSELKLIYSN